MPTSQVSFTVPLKVFTGVVLKLNLFVSLNIKMLVFRYEGETFLKNLLRCGLIRRYYFPLPYTFSGMIVDPPSFSSLKYRGHG